jgi:rhomboid protease GluP
MDYDIILFWFIAFSCLTGLIVVWKHARFNAPGWIVIYLAILLLSVAGRFAGQPAMIYGAIALWFALILLPGLVWRVCNRRIVQQKYAAARWPVRIISWLHPLDGWRETPKFVHALELAQQGEIAAASEVLNSLGNAKSLIGLRARIQLHRMMNQWEEILALECRPHLLTKRDPQHLPIALRARGEIGDVRGLVEHYEQHRQQIGRLAPASTRDTCRLMLFAFCGRRQAVERLFAGSLATLPASLRAFWLATADWAAGASESARRQFEEMLPGADPLQQRAVEGRLSQIATPPDPLDAAAQQVVDDAEQDRDHEETFGVHPSLFSRRACATQILIVLNVAMFFVECWRGGGEDWEVLYRLGGLYPPDVCGGQWWRLIAAMFLHFGALHLTMNMFGLWIFGPFVEFALGFRRFLFVYLLTGIGSMATVMAVSFLAREEVLLVGASGCVMGLLGATGALMLRGWLREKAVVARRRLALMVWIVVMEIVFDCTVPHVSMTAHLSGALIGFAATLLLRDRLTGTALTSSRQ